MKFAVKELNMANETIKKYIDTDKSYKSKIFYSSPLNDGVK
jgi:hypothetical protein